ncbi:uncharacterized protein LOC117239319 [Bombus vosnesenskii]|uniref:Uncharacterized protein LOC117239319 n=1 Tax=Bombus vosnesenskii TaxID=207650 RepID=A0A6J3L9W9_9HYME|nr:uncharacterized protein LOC117239319 [Bombus vosnesenskii]
MTVAVAEECRRKDLACVLVALDVKNAFNTLSRVVKYLGVVLDSAKGFSPHLKAVYDKAERFLCAIRSLLPNVGGPNDLVRRLYYGVWESVVLYGAPIWASSLGKETNRTILRRAQRAALIRTSTAYRTVSHGALCVLTGSMPIYIKTWLRWKQYGVKRRINESPEEMAHVGQEEMKVLETETGGDWSGVPQPLQLD